MLGFVLIMILFAGLEDKLIRFKFQNIINLKKILYLGPKLFNMIPKSIFDVSSSQSMRKYLKTFLLNI
jgi:hypothetical protein